MKTHAASPIPVGRPTLILLGLTVLSLAATRDTAPSPGIQHKIDVLLKSWLKPEALPVNPPNPFQVMTGLRREVAPDDPAARRANPDVLAATALPVRDDRPREATGQPAGPGDSDVLISCATRLKLGGIIVIKDQIQIVVNGVPRKEGDNIAADWNNTIVYLRITRLLPGQMVLRYNEAEATVKF